VSLQDGMGMSAEQPPHVPDLASFDWSRLQADGLVERVEYLPSISSTNDFAREAAGSLPRGERLLVVAERQTAGRGRGSNRWWTGGGSLAFSLLFDPAARNIGRRHYPMISLAASIAVIETVTDMSRRSDVGLHWPNDVFLAGRKLAGVLVEALSDGRHVLGVGCNVQNRSADAPPELAGLVISLAEVLDSAPHRGDVLFDTMRRFDARLDELARCHETVGRRAHELCLQHGAALTLRAGSREVSGTCAGIAADGALLLDTVNGRQSFYSGVLVKPSRDAPER
jgi:BirA family biotin operon repressor/biotin-[acetyl-CoA-carboxylase] ligase